MRLREFEEPVSGQYDAKSDEVTRAEITDTRKKVLTLLDLNKLKKLRAFRNLQNLKRLDQLDLIYGQVDDEQSM